jgi:hypothetical protein
VFPKASPIPPFHNPVRRVAVFAAVLCGCAAIAWTSLGHWHLPEIGPRQHDYNNLLVSGFQKGSLALDIEVSQALKDAKDPLALFRKSPDIAPHDVSLYRGRFYSYYGAVPAVVLFWPFRILFGRDLPLVLGSLCFGIGAFALISALWLRMVRDHFPRAGWTTRIAGLCALGLAGGQWVLARRVSIWEPSIEAGNFFLVAMLACAYRALHTRRPWAWLAASGLALGLATGSRPTLATAGLGLVPLVLAVGLGPGELEARSRWPRLTKVAFAAGLPLAAVVAALLYYNWARFGNAFELGLNHQLSTWNGDNKTAFSPSFIPFNSFLYFLSAPQWGRYFPFLHPIAYPGLPLGYYGYEYVYGAILVCPVLWWALGVPALIRGADAAVRSFGAVVLGVALGTTLVIFCFNTAAARYETDFLPWWVFFGVLGWALLEDRLRARGLARMDLAACAAFLVTAGFSCLMAFCASAEIHGILENEDPATYHRLSGILDVPTVLLERLTGFKGGAVEMNVTFDGRARGSVEPLVVTGIEYQRDYAYVFYQSDRVVRLCYVHPGEPVASSADIAIVPGRSYPVRVEFGSLYPPEGSPAYHGWLPAEVNARKRWVKIAFDGRTVLVELRRSNEATPGTVQVGADTESGFVGRRFAGTVADVRRVGLERPLGDLAAPGDLRILATLPRDPGPLIEPLLSAGRRGLADLVGLRVPDPGHYVFAYEAWGTGAWESPLFPMPADRHLDVSVRVGSVLGIDEASPLAVLSRSVVFWEKGRPVWWHRTIAPLGPRAPDRLMANIIGSSATAEVFGGRLDSVTRIPVIASWLSGPFAALDMQLGGRGEGCEPLVATGAAGRADTLGIDWLGHGRARLVYDHWSQPLRASAPFDWDPSIVRTVRLEMPSFRRLGATPGGGGEGRLRVQVDGSPVWDLNVPYFNASSREVSVGRNASGSSVTRAELQSVVITLRQEPQG